MSETVTLIELEFDRKLYARVSGLGWLKKKQKLTQQGLTWMGETYESSWTNPRRYVTLHHNSGATIVLIEYFKEESVALIC